MPKWKPQVHQIQDIETEVEGEMEKWQSKKLIVATMSSREMGQKRRDEGKTTSSQMHTATEENQRSDRSTSEGGCKDKLKKVDGHFPTCMRHKRDNNDDNTRKNEDL